MNLSCLNELLSDKSIRVISEVYAVIQLLAADEQAKLPESVVRYFKAHSDASCIPELTPLLPLELQDISDDAWDVIRDVVYPYLDTDSD
ncbi:MAG: hypothetical protein IJD60_12375 [Clostridia bacterium]|nr:hypothetical protein [Clostridia bacterium]